MSKKEKTRKKVFGLVSKLGNLIKKGTTTTNTDNMDTSAGENEIPKKSFNIQISEDNQEEIELDDEEEEEEEENEQEKKKELKEDKKENKDKEENTIEIKEKENNNINKEDNIDQNKQKDLIDNKEESKKEKEEIKEENNTIKDIDKDKEKKNISIEEEKIETNKIILNDKKLEINANNKEEKIKNENDNKEEYLIEEDINETSHLYLKKGNVFNYKEIYCIPLTQIKNQKKKSLLQKMNIFKKPKNEEIIYIIFIEENFIYFAKDIIVDKKNEDLRRIYKVYNIRNILNYTSNKEKESNKYKIEIEIMNKKLVRKYKEYFIEENYYNEFNDIIKQKLDIYTNVKK